MKKIIENIEAGIKSGLAKARENDNYSVVVCPFCGEDEFDLPGLKYHLLSICSEFNETEDII